jgi:hypothetical protein
MVVIRQIAPYIIEAAGELVKDTLRTYVDSKAPKGPLEPEPLVTIIEPTEQDSSCPYCTVIRMLCYAHRSLERAKEKPDLVNIYTEIATNAVGEAVGVMHRLEPSIENGRILTKLHKLEVTLLRPLTGSELDRVASDLWALTDLCYELAEAVQE